MNELVSALSRGVGSVDQLLMLTRKSDQRTLSKMDLLAGSVGSSVPVKNTQLNSDEIIFMAVELLRIARFSGIGDEVVEPVTRLTDLIWVAVVSVLVDSV